MHAEKSCGRVKICGRAGYARSMGGEIVVVTIFRRKNVNGDKHNE